MMKLRKIILFCVILTMCYSNVFAAGITYDVKNNNLQISGTLGEDYAYRMVALQMNGPFESPTEFPEAIESVENEFVKLQKTEFTTLYLDKNGNFNYNFYPQVGNRFYSVAAYVQGFEDVWSKTFLNVDDTLEGTVVSLLNAAQTSEDIKDIFDNVNYYNILTYYHPIFRNIVSQDNKDLVYEVLYHAKEQQHFTDLKDSYGNAIVPISVVMNINEMTENQAEDARLIAHQNMTLNVPLYEIYNEMSQAEQQNVFKRLLGVRHTGVSDFENSFDAAIFLQMIESEPFKKNLEGLLNTYATTYNVDITGYSDNIGEVNDAIYGKYFKNTTELSEAIAGVVGDDDDDEPVHRPGPGSSTSNREPSFGSSVFVPAVTNPDNAVVAETKIFDDLDNVAWAKEAIEALYERGVINGRGEKIFDPNSNVKREEFVKMLLLATEQSTDGDSVDFADVSKDEWYYTYIASGVKLGWIKGISETNFGVGAPLTRQDMAVLIARAAEIQAEVSQEQFLDDSMISDYAREAVYRLRNAGIINGDADNKFNPKSYATRAEAAKVLYGIMKEGR